MSQTASFAVSLVGSGVVQIVFGVAILVLDVIGLVYGFSVPGLFMGIIFGVFYIITGSLFTAAGTAARNGSGNRRCLAIASLVMSTLSSLNSFSLLVWTGLSLTALLTVNFPSICHNALPQYICQGLIYHGPGLFGADIAFLVIIFFNSIVACVCSAKIISSLGTTATYATRVI